MISLQKEEQFRSKSLCSNNQKPIMTVSIVYHTSGSSLSYQAWNNVIKSFNIDYWEEIGNKFKDVSSFMRKYNDFLYVMLVPEHAVPKGVMAVELKHFIHPPKDVCYVFGDERDGITQSDLKEADFIVTIKTHNELLSYLAAAITFNDRENKKEMN